MAGNTYTKLIAIGNLLMKDDGAAIKVVEKIRPELEKNNVEVIIGETDIQYCISMVEDGDFIIVVDAALSGKKPGELTVCDMEDYIQKVGCRSQHELNFLNLIKVNYSKINAYIIGIEVQDIEYGGELSNTLADNFQDICVRTFKCIQNLIYLQSNSSTSI